MLVFNFFKKRKRELHPFTTWNCIWVGKLSYIGEVATVLSWINFPLVSMGFSQLPLQLLNHDSQLTSPGLRPRSVLSTYVLCFQMNSCFSCRCPFTACVHGWFSIPPCHLSLTKCFHHLSQLTYPGNLVVTSQIRHRIFVVWQDLNRIAVSTSKGQAENIVICSILFFYRKWQVEEWKYT